MTLSPPTSTAGNLGIIIGVHVRLTFTRQSLHLLSFRITHSTSVITAFLGGVFCFIEKWLHFDTSLSPSATPTRQHPHLP